MAGAGARFDAQLGRHQGQGGDRNTGRHRGIGMDLVNHCVNDILLLRRRAAVLP